MNLFCFRHSIILATTSTLLHACASFSWNANTHLAEEKLKSQCRTDLVFPGGGIFFYWQAGVITYLREQNYNILDDDTIHFTGASAGALCASLTSSGVDFEHATELALNLAEDYGVWDRPLGLQGIWGSMIESWLDELLPENAAEMSQGKLSLLITQIPTFKKNKISTFETKSDLIRCNMASVHIPLFLDSKLTTNFRGKPHIDGSFMAQPTDYHQLFIPSSCSSVDAQINKNIIFLDWKKDPILSDRNLADAVAVISKQGIWDLLDRGRSYASSMEKRGDFDLLLRNSDQ